MFSIFKSKHHRSYREHGYSTQPGHPNHLRPGRATSPKINKTTLRGQSHFPLISYCRLYRSGARVTRTTELGKKKVTLRSTCPLDTTEDRLSPLNGLNEGALGLRPEGKGR
jgi:hypothetical protein